MVQPKLTFGVLHSMRWQKFLEAKVSSSTSLWPHSCQLWIQPNTKIGSKTPKTEIKIPISTSKSPISRSCSKKRGVPVKPNTLALKNREVDRLLKLFRDIALDKNAPRLQSLPGGEDVEGPIPIVGFDFEDLYGNGGIFFNIEDLLDPSESSSLSGK